MTIRNLTVTVLAAAAMTLTAQADPVFLWDVANTSGSVLVQEEAPLADWGFQAYAGLGPNRYAEAYLFETAVGGAFDVNDTPFQWGAGGSDSWSLFRNEDVLVFWLSQGAVIRSELYLLEDDFAPEGNALAFHLAANALNDATSSGPGERSLDISIKGTPFLTLPAGSGAFGVHAVGDTSDSLWVVLTGLDLSARQWVVFGDLSMDWVGEPDFGDAGDIQFSIFGGNYSPPVITSQGIVPEPSSLALLGIGAAGLLGRRAWMRVLSLRS